MRSKTISQLYIQPFLITILPYYCAEYTGQGGVEEDADIVDDGGQPGGAWVRSLFSTDSYPDEIGPSQLGGAPLLPTQVSQEDFTTPVADETRRPTRQVVPPDPLTYSQQHTRAAQVAERRARGGAQRHKRGRI